MINYAMRVENKNINNEGFVVEDFSSYLVLKPIIDDKYLVANPIVITTYYSFVELERPEVLRDKLSAYCKENAIMGTILLGTEGINSTVCGIREDIDKFYDYITSLEDLKTNEYKIEFKETYFKTKPFRKVKVRVKKEIVTFGGVCGAINAGNYIEPEEWDEFIKRDDVILVDTRNDYEYDIGTFEGAINPNTENFKQFADWIEQNKEAIKDKKFAMFCTGGIRCEKSTTYAKQMGFDNVYHLKGGIIAHFIKTKNKNKTWVGKCFVFDDRTIISPELND